MGEFIEVSLIRREKISVSQPETDEILWDVMIFVVLYI